MVPPVQSSFFPLFFRMPSWRSGGSLCFLLMLLLYLFLDFYVPVVRMRYVFPVYKQTNQSVTSWSTDTFFGGKYL